MKNSLTYAANRQSITRASLRELLKDYLIQNTDVDAADRVGSRGIWNLVSSEISICSAGKEIVLIESLDPRFDLMVVELFRFDDTGGRRISFRGDELVWNVESNVPPSKVVFRCSSHVGFERFVERNPHFFHDKRIAFVPARGIEDADESEVAQMHSAKCDRLLRERSKVLICLHCGRAVSQQRIMMAEIDDLDSDHQIGAIHDECRRAIDRIVGQYECPFFEGKTFLRELDVDRWCQLLLDGQDCFRDKRIQGPHLGQQTVSLVWNPDNDDYRRFSHCVQINLKDGSCVHLTSRGKLDRYTARVAEYRAREANEHFHRARLSNDPLCFTSVNRYFGPYSQLLAQKDSDEGVLECVDALTVNYTEQVGRLYPKERQYYTPLLLLVDVQAESPIVIKSSLVLLTNPLVFGNTVDNWREAGIDVSDYAMHIIENDREFDAEVSKAFHDGIGAVIDPLFDRNGDLVRGYVVRHFDDAMDSLRASHGTRE